jgi:hypothetical protein
MAAATKIAQAEKAFRDSVAERAHPRRSNSARLGRREFFHYVLGCQRAAAWKTALRIICAACESFLG